MSVRSFPIPYRAAKAASADRLAQSVCGIAYIDAGVGKSDHLDMIDRREKGFPVGGIDSDDGMCSIGRPQHDKFGSAIGLPPKEMATIPSPSSRRGRLGR